jgi:hypothetical protein
MQDANLVLIRKKVYDAIADLLGVYNAKTTTGAVQSKAITVLEHADLANDYPIEGTGLTGLEAVIVPTKVNPSALIGSRKIERTYLILLFQRDKNKGIREAVDRLLATDLQIINNGIDINVDIPKSKTYKVAAITVRYYSQVSFA